MDLEDTEKFLARMRQREEEIGNENCFMDSFTAAAEVGDKKEVSNETEKREEPVTKPDNAERKPLYPVEQLRRLSEEASKDSFTVDTETTAAGSISSTSGEKPQRRSVFADLAANIDNYEVDLKPRSKTAKSRKSAGRVSAGETRASALFTPNTNYYAPLGVVKSPKKQVSGYLEPVIEDIQKLSDGEFGDEEKQPTGPFESTTLQGSPFGGPDKGESKETNIKKFFEKQPGDFTSPGIFQGSKVYEPSPIPKALSSNAPGLQETPVRSSIMAAFRETRGDIVDKLTMAANDATKGLNDLPATSGRAKQIAQKLEEKVRSECCSAPLPAAPPTKKSVACASVKKMVDTTTNVHIHYRLNVPTVRNVPKVVPIIDTTPANVRSLRSRWEVSSSSGAPLHPDQDEDDLLQAARKISRDVKQAREHRVRPMSYYEPREAVEVPCERNTLACASRTLSTGSVYVSEMEVSREKPSVIFEPPKEDEKGVKRGSSSTENDDDDVFTAEKKMKREENDITKLSGNLVGEALEAFNFLNETANKTPSFLSSILDSTSESQHPMVMETPKMPERDSDNDDDIPLVHSVSFYRKKKKELKCVGETTVLGQFTTSPPQNSGPPAELFSPSNEVPDGEKFALERKRLEDAIRVQDEQILQASKAFTHCRKNLEFRGSRIEVDAQRALLIATESRRALIYVLDNLLQSYSRGIRVKDSNKPRGTLTIKDISLRLMRDFINGHVNYHSDQMLYYFIVLIRHEEAVHHTAMVTSDDGLQSGHIAFPNYIQLKSLPHDFTCTLEVYALRTKRELMGHSTTTKKATKLQSFHQGFLSPGTPSAVIDPSFQKIGKLTLNIGNVAKGKFHLTDVMSPLDGAVTMTLTCFPEETGTIGYKGFLSLYQEVEAIASWTRFWCVLNDGNLRFWKYPEDEATKKPVVIINLRDSACEEIRSLSAESCPYPHSMTIDIWIESASKKGKHEKIRIMMAADTKEDMHRWLTVLNGSLRNITLWYPKR